VLLRCGRRLRNCRSYNPRPKLPEGALSGFPPNMLAPIGRATLLCFGASVVDRSRIVDWPVPLLGMHEQQDTCARQGHRGTASWNRSISSNGPDQTSVLFPFCASANRGKDDRPVERTSR
jgi:hypothetical protein